MAAETRRLAAIVAADIAGYSGLMAADEAGTLARLKSMRAESVEPAVASFGGNIVGSAGDSLLVEFGSVVKAVDCAVNIQTVLAVANAELPDDRRMEFRMGVYLGDVIADGGTIYGDGVNIAARLEKLAEPGGICIGGNVYDQIKGKLPFACADLGEQKMHNIAEAHMLMSGTYGYGGMPEEGMHHVEIAMRLSPRDPIQPANLSNIGTCHFMAGRYAEAAEFQRRAVQLRPHFGTAWRSLAAAAGMAGDLTLAASALASALRLQPSLTLECIKTYHPIVRHEDHAATPRACAGRACTDGKSADLPVARNPERPDIDLRLAPGHDVGQHPARPARHGPA